MPSKQIRIKTENDNKNKETKYEATVLKLIERCRSADNLDRKLEMLYSINLMLLKSDQLSMPSIKKSRQLTAGYIDDLLHILEGKMI
jgi:hypothetical protein